MPRDERHRRDAAIRPFWAGVLSFGLVSIPVDLYPATRSLKAGLRMLHRDGTPLSRRYYCPATDTEVPPEEIVRGYPVDGDRFVVVTDEDLEAVEPVKSREIDLRRFVEADAIQPVYCRRAYYLAPAGGSTKAYRLLAEVMQRTARAGVATFVMRGKEYLVAITSDEGILRAETLRFQDELRAPEEAGLPDRVPVPSGERRRVEREIEGRTRPELDPGELKDENSERLRALAESKRRKGTDIVEAPEPEAAGAEPPQVVDLMEVLKERLAARAADRVAPGRARRSRATAGAGEDLESLTRAELYERARALDIPRRSRMSKGELVRALRRAA